MKQNVFWQRNKTVVLFLTLIAAILAVSVIVMAYVRLAPSNPSRWHVDPTTAARPDTPNYYFELPTIKKRPAPVFVASAPDLAKAFDDFVLSQPHTTRLAGNAADLWVTYVQRTETMKYPDYISIKFIDLADGTATVAIFSRSRFGVGDKWFNKKRILHWLTALDNFERVEKTGN